jgi:tetratricopeptide (TPR) repeat protein
MTFDPFRHGILLNPLVRLTLLACICVAPPLAALAQTNAPAKSSPVAQGPSPALPAAAQDLFDKGLIAARIPDYLQAINYFEQARAVVPLAPEILYNLGLAESKIPGRELRAICWFAAYLDTSPTPANAPAVKQEIDELDVRSHSNLSRIIRSLQEIVNKIPLAGNREAPLQEVALLWLEVGDMSNARLIIDAAEPAVKLEIAHDVVFGGFPLNPDKIGIAKSLVLEVGSDMCKNIVGNQVDVMMVVKKLADADDIDGALNLLQQCRSSTGYTPEYTGDAWIAVARAQSKKKDWNAVRGSLVESRKDPSWNPVNDSGADTLYADMGDFSEAQKVVDLYATMTGNRRLDFETYIFFAQVQHGDLPGARKTAASYCAVTAPTTDLYYCNYMENSLHQLDAGNIANISPLFEDPLNRQPASPRSIQASNWTDEEINQLSVPLFTDVSGFLQSQQSDDPQIFANQLGITALDLVREQLKVEEMLKNQAQER